MTRTGGIVFAASVAVLLGLSAFCVRLMKNENRALKSDRKAVCSELADQKTRNAELATEIDDLKKTIEDYERSAVIVERQRQESSATAAAAPAPKPPEQENR